MVSFFRLLKNQHAFTLIEMTIVLLIISVLLLIALPNMTKSNEVVKQKSCDATIRLVQSQVAAYEAENDVTLTSLDPLQETYVDRLQCPDGRPLVLENGKVTVEE
ncbi:competence type IV pilus major pilin ComGC [Tuberibacillus calidus]|jgi:competence protein ComGC|uniref:competence type IV pilus major pilin ComGC n=1 Tax=Tuberibacillus calidus TaxID=340097 RepID=UPI00041F7B5E